MTRTPVYTAYFEVHEASDQAELLDQCFELRYEVYCNEREFLKAEDYPTHRESDSFDRQSAHFLARHRNNGYAAGTARLVKQSEQGFPMLEHCSIDPEHADLLTPDVLSTCGEVSRVAVSKRFRRRAGDDVYGGPPRTGGEASEDNPQPITVWPEIVSGLYKAMYQEAARSGIKTLIVAMERGLHVLLRRMHMRFVPIGPEVDYYGPVRPYLLDLEAGAPYLLKKSPGTLFYLLNGLEERYWPEVARNVDLTALSGHSERDSGKARRSPPGA